ncbi:MAG: hypothetical protein Kow0032_24430 [Methyloligellaceae bacterium]
METSFLSLSARKGISTLKRFDALFRQTSHRLASGRKVNRASDGPAAFFTAKALNARASDLGRAIDTVSTRLGAVRAADQGVRALTRLVQVAQGIVESARGLPQPEARTTGSVDVQSAGDVTALAGVSAGDQFSVQVGSAAAVTVTVSSGETPDALLADLNAIEGVAAEFTSSGQLRVSTTNGEALTLADVSGTPLAGLGLTAGTIAAESPARAAKAQEFNALLTQIDQLAADAGFLGVNLLQGDRPALPFNADASSSLTLSGIDASAAGLGLSSASGGFANDAEVSAAADGLRGALGGLRSFSARLSSDLAVAGTRQEFVKGLQQTLRAGADDLTLADINAEAASLLALETRTSLAATGFSITQRAESNVLRLFD